MVSFFNGCFAWFSYNLLQFDTIYVMVMHITHHFTNVYENYVTNWRTTGSALSWSSKRTVGNRGAIHKLTDTWLMPNHEQMPPYIYYPGTSAFSLPRIANFRTGRLPSTHTRPSCLYNYCLPVFGAWLTTQILGIVEQFADKQILGESTIKSVEIHPLWTGIK